MTLTLTANIDADDRVLGVTGTVPDGIGPGYRFRLDDELLDLTGFEHHDVDYPANRQQDPNRNRWYVRRGLVGSTAASHTAGAAILGATDAFVSAESGETAPGPFAVDGGASAVQRNVGQCRLDFAAVSVDTTALDIPLTFGDGDETMVDLTTPAYPNPVEAGVYAYTAVVNQDGGGDATEFIASLKVDDDWYSLNLDAYAGGVHGATSFSSVSLSVTWYSDAASPFALRINSVGDDAYSGYLYVQKVA